MPATQVSFSVQTLASASHPGPVLTGLNTQLPLAGSQLSSVHVLPSLHGLGLPNWQAPLLHLSSTVQALPSSHLPALGVFRQPLPWGSQRSVVQGFLSSQSTGAPALHAPPAHPSPRGHGLASLQGVPAPAACWAHLPVPGSHADVMQAEASVHVTMVAGSTAHFLVSAQRRMPSHGLLSLQSASVLQSHTDLPPLQSPPLVQLSPSVQASPSSHGWPSLTACVQPSLAEQVSTVQGFLSSQLTALAPLH